MMISERKHDRQVLVERDEERGEERGRGDGGGGKLFEKTLVGARMNGAALGDRFPPMAAGPEEVEADEGDQDEGGEQVDHQQVSNESEIKKRMSCSQTVLLVKDVKLTKEKNSFSLTMFLTKEEILTKDFTKIVIF